MFFSYNLSCVKIMNKTLKMFYCLTLLCVVVCVLRDGWLSPQNIFSILFIILTHGKLKLKNTKINNLYLGKCTHCSSVVPYNRHADDG